MTCGANFHTRSSIRRTHTQLQLHTGTFVARTTVSPTTEVAASGTQTSYQNKNQPIFGNTNNGSHHKQLTGAGISIRWDLS
jgi:hypothetical protein